MTGLFIVIDGVDGCGKSTQVELLAEHLSSAGHDVVVTYEPGGTAIGDRIRELLLDREHNEMTALTEALLFCAGRAQHCDELIRPALDRGQIVISDRFASATAAYQGYAGGLGLDTVERVNEVATGGLAPDLLFILDLDAAEGMRRKYGAGRGERDRIEGQSAQFHEKVREGFIEYARRFGEGSVIVDADGPVEEISRRISEQVEAALG